MEANDCRSNHSVKAVGGQLLAQERRSNGFSLPPAPAAAGIGDGLNRRNGVLRFAGCGSLGIVRNTSISMARLVKLPHRSSQQSFPELPAQANRDQSSRSRSSAIPAAWRWSVHRNATMTAMHACRNIVDYRHAGFVPVWRH